MIRENELLDIELRNRGNEDVARLLAAIRAEHQAMRHRDYRKTDNSQPSR